MMEIYIKTSGKVNLSPLQKSASRVSVHGACLIKDGSEMQNGHQAVSVVSGGNHFRGTNAFDAGDLYTFSGRAEYHTIIINP